MERVIKILKELHPEVDFEMESELVDSGILDSLDIVSLVPQCALLYAFDPCGAYGPQGQKKASQ